MLSRLENGHFPTAGFSAMTTVRGAPHLEKSEGSVSTSKIA
jgi:hypothetical protein